MIKRRIKEASWFVSTAICLLLTLQGTKYCFYRAYDLELNLDKLYTEWFSLYGETSSLPHYEILAVFWQGLALFIILIGCLIFSFLSIHLLPMKQSIDNADNHDEDAPH